MDQNLKDESGVNKDVPLRSTNNKCNQCDFASSHVSGEKPKKCNQCDYSSSEAGKLRRHLLTHSGEKPNKWNQCDFIFACTLLFTVHEKCNFNLNQTKNL